MIREAAAADVNEIQALMQSVPGFWDQGWRADVLQRALTAAGTVALVSVESEHTVGFACAHDVGFRAYLSELIVAPSSRRSGIGGQLLAAIEHRMAARGCAILIADVWRDAEPFYRSQGWTPPPVVLLRKRLIEPGAGRGEIA